MTSARGVMPIIALCAVLAVAAIGVGYALTYTSTTTVDDNDLGTAYLVVYPNGTSTYVHNFSSTIEYHTGTVITDRVTSVEYSPCSWYMRHPAGIPASVLGTIALTVDSSEALSDLTISIVPDDPSKIYAGDYTEGHTPNPAEYLVETVIGETYIYDDFDRDSGVTIEIPPQEASTLNLSITIYLKAEVVYTKPDVIFDNASFVITATNTLD